MSLPLHRRLRYGALIIATACVAGTLAAPAAHADDPAPVNVTVNARAGLATVPAPRSASTTPSGTPSSAPPRSPTCSARPGSR